MTYEGALKLLNDMEFADKYQGKDEHTTMLLMCKEALNKQIAKKPIWAEEIYEHHDWQKDEDGKIDEWGMSFGYCNGPLCKRCYHSFCKHCHSDEYEERLNEKCDCSHYECPNCHKVVSKGVKVCTDCGQALDWSDIVKKWLVGNNEN